MLMGNRRERRDCVLGEKVTNIKRGWSGSYEIGPEEMSEQFGLSKVERQEDREGRERNVVLEGRFLKKSGMGFYGFRSAVQRREAQRETRK